MHILKGLFQNWADGNMMLLMPCIQGYAERRAGQRLLTKSTAMHLFKLRSRDLEVRVHSYLHDMSRTTHLGCVDGSRG